MALSPRVGAPFLRKRHISKSKRNLVSKIMPLLHHRLFWVLNPFPLLEPRALAFARRDERPISARASRRRSQVWQLFQFSSAPKTSYFARVLSTLDSQCQYKSITCDVERFWYMRGARHRYKICKRFGTGRERARCSGICDLRRLWTRILQTPRSGCAL